MSRPLHLALAQFKPRKGNYAANLDRIGRVLAQAAALDPRPDVVQLPETALTGYFVEGAVRDLAVTAGTLARDLNAAYLHAAPGGGPLDVVVGFYETWQSTLHNSAMYVTLAAPDGDDAPAPVIRHVHRKHFLPTYGLFDEERFVERGFDIRAFDAPWGRAAMLVCEDAWHSLTGTIAALDGAQVVFVCAAAPARGTTTGRRCRACGTCTASTSSRRTASSTRSASWSAVTTCAPSTRRGGVPPCSCARTPGTASPARCSPSTGRR